MLPLRPHPCFLKWPACPQEGLRVVCLPYQSAMQSEADGRGGLGPKPADRHHLCLSRDNMGKEEKMGRRGSFAIYTNYVSLA